MKILYLHSKVLGYTMATINELSDRYGVEIHVVYMNTNSTTQFQRKCTKNVTFYARSAYSVSKIKALAGRITPDLLVVSGWMDKEYLEIARFYRKMGVPVVTGIDNQWHGTLKQYTASLFGFYLRRFFSHAWVAGSNQFELLNIP